MATCMICNKVGPVYVNEIGNFCQNCYWEITHNPDPEDDRSRRLIKGYNESWKLSEWFERMALVAKRREQEKEYK